MGSDPYRPLASDPYGAVAPYYDLGIAGFDDDLGLYLGLAKRVGGRVLELGCGTGRLLEALADSGFEVVGVDRSGPMLAQARRRLLRRGAAAGLLQGTICQPPVGGQFGLILLALGTFQHLLTSQEQRACLLAARALLDRGGLLVLDLPAPSAPGWEDWSPGARPLVPAWSARLADGSRLDKLSSFSADASAQTHTVTELYDLTLLDGTLQRTVVEYALRFVFPAELELLFDLAGLTLYDRYGDYDLGPFTAVSVRQICVAGPA